MAKHAIQNHMVIRWYRPQRIEPTSRWRVLCVTRYYMSSLYAHTDLEIIITWFYSSLNFSRIDSFCQSRWLVSTIVGVIDNYNILSTLQYLSIIIKVIVLYRLSGGGSVLIVTAFEPWRKRTNGSAFYYYFILKDFKMKTLDTVEYHFERIKNNGPLNKYSWHADHADYEDVVNLII